MVAHSGYDPQSVNTDSFSIASRCSKYGKPGLTPTEQRIFQTYIPPGTRILIIGCGGGRVSIPLWQQGHDVDALDISKDMIDVAQKNARSAPPGDKTAALRHFQANAVEHDFGQEKYGAVVIPFNSLDYILPLKARDKVLGKAYRALQASGLLIYSSHVHHLPRNKKSLLYHCINVLNGNLFRQKFRARTAYGSVIRYQGLRQHDEIKNHGFELIKQFNGQNEASRISTPWIYYVARKRAQDAAPFKTA